MNFQFLFQQLYLTFAWFTPFLRSLFRLTSTKMADFGSLIFQSEDPDDEPSADELYISEELSPRERLESYSKSDLIIHRLFVLRDLENTTAELGPEGTILHALPILKILSDDVEPVVRAATMESIPGVANLLMQDPQGGQIILQEIIPLIQKLLIDKNVQTQEKAHSAFVKICETVGKDDLQENIFRLIVKLLSNLSEEDSRVEALALLNDLAPIFHRNGIVHLIRPKVLESSVDPSFRVRKGCVEVLATLCQFLNEEEIADRLLPLYLDLCSDKIWGVRKACAYALPAFSQYSSAKSRGKELLETFDLLNRDVSRWVKSAVLESLGPLIATFLHDPQIPSILIDNYEKMAFGEADLVLSCAFNFPAVILTVGPSQWPRLRSTFGKLSGDMQWKVRRTLSFSLHELGKILGPDITEEDLAPVFDLFLRDLDDVKIGVITHFSKFVACSAQEHRSTFLEKIADLQSSPIGWRFKELLARQMPELSEISTTEDVENFLVPQILNFCRDSVNVVRLASIPGVCKILQTFKVRGKEEIFDMFANEIKKLGTQPSFSGRQFFAQLCGSLVEIIEPQEFMTLFFPLLIALSNDSVVNVRISVAETLRKNISTLEFFHDNKFVATTLEKLRHDEDIDVIRAAL